MNKVGGMYAVRTWTQVTGEMFKPNLPIIAKNVTRGLLALVRHTNVCMSRLDSVTSFKEDSEA